MSTKFDLPARLFLAGVLLAAVGCNASTSASVRLSAQGLRDGCVGETLDVLQGIAERLAPMSAASSDDVLFDLAVGIECSLVPAANEGDFHLLSCTAVPARGGPVTVRARFRLPDAGRMEALVEIEGDGLFGEGSFDLVRDPERGVGVSGSLSLVYLDGCVVEAELVDVFGRLVADAPSGSLGLVFAQGNVELSVVGAFAGEVHGTAALSGRTAVVVLDVDGEFQEGLVEMGARS